MKILVTGGTGFIGRHLVERLNHEGYSIKILVRPQSQTNIFKGIDAEFSFGDIEDYEAVEKAISDCQRAFHLAGLTSRRKDSKKSYLNTNVKGTNNILRAAANTGIERIVHVSTSGVYGIIKNPPANENTPTNPNTAYRASKLLAEKIALKHYQELGLPVVIARLSSTVGAGCLSWLGLCKAVASNKFKLIGDGENHLHFSHVLDTVDGLMRCAQVPNIEGEKYLIAHHKPTKLKELISVIEKVLNIEIQKQNSSSTLFHIYFSLSQFFRTISGLELPRSHQFEMFLANRELTIYKAQKDLNFQPSMNIQDALLETIEWYAENGKI